MQKARAKSRNSSAVGDFGAAFGATLAAGLGPGFPFDECPLPCPLPWCSSAGSSAGSAAVAAVCPLNCSKRRSSRCGSVDMAVLLCPGDRRPQERQNHLVGAGDGDRIALLTLQDVASAVIDHHIRVDGGHASEVITQVAGHGRGFEEVFG